MVPGPGQSHLMVQGLVLARAFWHSWHIKPSTPLTHVPTPGWRLQEWALGWVGRILREGSYPQRSCAQRCRSYNHYEQRGINRCVHIYTSRMSILGTQEAPQASQGWGTRAQRMRQEGPSPQGTEHSCWVNTGFEPLFPRAGSSGQSRCRHPTLHTWTSKADPKSWGLVSFQSGGGPPAPAGPGRQCERRPAWGMFLEALTAPRDGHAFKQVHPGPALKPRGFSRLLSPKRETRGSSCPLLHHVQKEDCGPRPGGLARVTGRPCRRVACSLVPWPAHSVLPAPVGTKPLEFKCEGGPGLASGRAQRKWGKPRGMTAWGREPPPPALLWGSSP